MDGYNGWRNRETWLVNVWYNPESPSDLEWIRDDLEEQVDKLPPVLQDFCYVSEIDWTELEQSLEQDSEEIE